MICAAHIPCHQYHSFVYSRSANDRLQCTSAPEIALSLHTMNITKELDKLAMAKDLQEHSQGFIHFEKFWCFRQNVL